MTVDLIPLTAPGPSTDKLGSALALAFGNAPDYAHILAGHRSKMRALSWFFGHFAARLALRYGSIQVTKDGDAGIVGFRPGQSPSPWALLRAGVLSFPWHFGWKASWRAFVLGLRMEQRRLELARMPHWYVVAVGVTPEKQGRGTGYELMTSIIQRAEAEGVPVYLEAFEADLTAGYQRRGFSILNDEVLPNGLRLRCMLRPS